MFARNEDIRELKGNIPFWIIAERLGVSENTVLNWMKKELTENKKSEFENVINQLKDEFSLKSID